MKILSDPKSARRYVIERQSTGETVAVVPTMGALHDGHLSLVEIGKEKCDRVVATIFVNPTQFAPGEDLDKYPRTLKQDLARLESLGTDAVFVPEVSSMYPDGCTTSVSPPRVAEGLEGSFRPEHFGGVCTIVLKLFQCLPCNVGVFGQKDYQQLLVIKAMVRDLNLPIEVLSGEIIRDQDGLAMSSRNRYLSAVERENALCIPKALRSLQDDVQSGVTSVEELQERLIARLEDSEAVAHAARDAAEGQPIQRGVDSLDYAVVVDSETLEPIEKLNRPAVALVAARVGQTRLIDNCTISV